MRIPKCRRPECPKSQTRIIVDKMADDQGFVTIRCFTCGSIQVKPNEKVEGAEKERIRQARIQEAMLLERQRAGRKKIFV